MPEHALNVYLVGGAVRDDLMGIPVKDRDWVVIGATPEQMVDLGFRPVGKDFPVFLHPETHEEYALARTERKVAKGYHGFTFNTSPGVTLEEDLARRDLTVNAIARSSDGDIVDPFGGRNDIEKETLRHISDAFSEDPVRILRTARFSARLGFQVAPETNKLMELMSRNGEVDALVPERVWAETVKALESDQPWLFIEVLRNCAALERVYPEINALFGVPQTEKHHPEVDTGIHTLMVLEQASRLTSNPETRFAALVHDLGKAVTPAEEWPSHRGHERRGMPLVAQLCDRLRVPKSYRSLAMRVCEYHLHPHRIRELKPTTVVNMLNSIDAFRNPEHFDRFLNACEADMRGRKGFEDQKFRRIDLTRAFYHAATQVDTAAIAGSFESGEDIRTEINRARASAIALSRKEHDEQDDGE
jgi:tRNA nucleotidyltransferase (CCA-adding enzyme)